MVNEQRMEREKINEDDIDILDLWEEEGYIEINSNIAVTKKFWDIINEFIWLSYVVRE